MNSDTNLPKSATPAAWPDREKLVLALGSNTRWRMIGELTCGEARSIGELATAGGCSYDAAIKHLKLLRSAGLVSQGRGRLYQLVPQYLPTPGEPVVDFGHCLLRLNAGK